MSSLQVAKKALRLELKSKLKNIPYEDKCSQSHIVIEKLLKNVAFQRSKRISIYLSRDIEIRTDGLLKIILDTNKDCFVPKYNSSNSLMEMVKLNSMDDYNSLPLTKWNIRQPPDNDTGREDALSTGGLDLMIVPGIGFTKEGNRIGNGRGYYDIYLRNYEEKLKAPVYTIALAFREQIITSIPCSDHDVVINEVIYPD